MKVTPLAGYNPRRLNVFMPEDYGAFGDGTTDDYAAFLDCYNALIAAGGGTFRTANKTYRINTALLFDMSKVIVDGGGARWDFSNMAATGAAITLFSTSTTAIHIKSAFSNVDIYGTTTAGHIGVQFGNNTANQYGSHLGLEACRIFGFATGVTWEDNSWSTVLHRVNIGGCTNIASFGTNTNSGESLSFSDCTFYDSTNGLDLAGAYSVFRSCRFDYNTNFALLSSNATLTDCFIESKYDGDYHFKTSGTYLDPKAMIVLVNPTFTHQSGAGSVTRTKAFTFGHEGTSGVKIIGATLYINGASTVTNYWGGVSEITYTTQGKSIPNFDNIAVNSNLEIWQRGTSFATIATGTFTADCWEYFKQTTGAVHTVAQETDVPTIAQAGYKIPFSISANTTTADAAVAASDLAMLRLRVEGYRFAPIAQTPFTLVGWVKGSKDGTVGLSLRNSGQDRSCLFLVTVTANTWTPFRFAVPASPSAGTWDYTTGRGISLSIPLIAGTDFQGATVGSWVTANNVTTSAQTNWCANTNDKLFIAGVMLLPGLNSTPMPRSFQEELALCQRYFEKTFNYSIVPADNAGRLGTLHCDNHQVTEQPEVRWGFMVPKRAAPTIALYSPQGGTSGQWRNAGNTASSANATSLNIGETGCLISNNGTALAVDQWEIQATATSNVP